MNSTPCPYKAELAKGLGRERRQHWLATTGHHVDSIQQGTQGTLWERPRHTALWAAKSVQLLFLYLTLLLKNSTNLNVGHK